MSVLHGRRHAPARLHPLPRSPDSVPPLRRRLRAQTRANHCPPPQQLAQSRSFLTAVHAPFQEAPLTLNQSLGRSSRSTPALAQQPGRSGVIHACQSPAMGDGGHHERGYSSRVWRNAKTKALCLRVPRGGLYRMRTSYSTPSSLGSGCARPSRLPPRSCAVGLDACQQRTDSELEDIVPAPAVDLGRHGSEARVLSRRAFYKPL